MHRPKMFTCRGSGSKKAMYGSGGFGSTKFAMRQIWWGI